MIDAPPTPDRERSLPKPRGGTETILVAEDDTDVRKLIRLVLAGNGYKVIEAVDGQDALALLSEQNTGVDLLLLDIIMPKKNGKGSLRHSQKCKRRSEGDIYERLHRRHYR